MLVHALFFGAVATSLASAQSLSISTSCVNSLKGLFTAPDAACLNAPALLSFVVGSNQSIPNTVNTWLTGLCSSGSCSNDSIAAIVTNVTAGCSAELTDAGLSSSNTNDIISIVQSVYPVVRKVACLKDDNADQLCVTETLNNLEGVVGALSLSDFSFLNLFGDVQKLISAGIDTQVCTNCIKEGFTIASEAFPGIVSQINSEAEGLCGANFIDGTAPEGITETDASGLFTASAQGNGALSSLSASSGFMGAMALIAIAQVLL